MEEQCPAVAPACGRVDGGHEPSESSARPQVFLPAPVACAIIVYMTTLPLAAVRANLSKLVEEAERTHQRVEVTKNGRRAAVLLSADDYDSLMETLDILSDSEAIAAIHESDADIAAGRIYSMDEVGAELRSKGIIK